MTDPIGSNRMSTLLGGTANDKGRIETESSTSRSGQQTSSESSPSRDHADQLVLSSAAKVLNEQSSSVSQAIETPQQAKEVMTQLRDAFVNSAGGADVHSNAMPSLIALLKQPA